MRNYAYVAEQQGGLAIVDVEDPSNPIPLDIPTTELTSGFAEGVFVSRSDFDNNNYAYIASHATGLDIIDVEDLTSPEHVLLVEIPVSGVALGIFVSGNYAYLAYDNGGLAVVDITNPRDAFHVANVDTPGSAMGVFADGEYVYVACGWDGSGAGSLVIYDVTDPENPHLVGGAFIPGGYAFGVYLKGNIAYVAYSNWDYTGGLAVFDVIDPTDPDKIADIPTGNSFDVYVKGDYAYVANDHKGLAVVNIADPAYPIEQIDTSGWAYKVFADSASEDAIVYVADQYSLSIIKHTVICEPPRGDVSGNCIISAYDSALILRHVTGIITLDAEQQSRADVSANGEISALDAAMVLQYTVGLIMEFPAAPTRSPKDEQKLLVSTISELERIPLSQEQITVLKQLKQLAQAFYTRTTLFQNYPNPFNPETWIPYQLKNDSNITIRIMDIQGRLVRQIDLGNKPAGVYISRDNAAYWDGRNSLGEKVSSGIYFYTLQVEHLTQSPGANSGKFTSTKKMVIMK
jgi:hypothetical protein